MIHNHGPEEGPGTACRERRIGECILSPSTESVVEADRMIRAAQTIRASNWYRAQQKVLQSNEYPTLALTLWLVDTLAIYSARDRGPASGS